MSVNVSPHFQFSLFFQKSVTSWETLIISNRNDRRDFSSHAHGIWESASLTSRHYRDDLCSVYLVRSQRFAFAGERDVAVGLPLEQLREHGLQVAVMVLPSQAVLLWEHVGRWRWRWWGWGAGRRSGRGCRCCCYTASLLKHARPRRRRELLLDRAGHRRVRFRFTVLSSSTLSSSCVPPMSAISNELVSRGVGREDILISLFKFQGTLKETFYKSHNEIYQSLGIFLSYATY